jgi:carboxyl-terminal processing protease
MGEGMDKMILDLRDNPGGYLHSAKQISNAFLSKNQTIVITKTNMGEEEKSFAKGDGVFQEGGLIILVNEQSASASEIVAGAVQDNDRGWIIGRRTFGKGLVQKQMPLGGGDAVRLTIAKYYTPSGRSIQKPYSNNGRKDYYEDLNNRFENGEMADEKKIPIIDSLAFKTASGRTVYGGGGITPDNYVSNKNTQEEEWNDLILNSPLISNFVFNELDQNRKAFSKLKETQLLNNRGSSILPSYQEFSNYCKTNGIEFKNGKKETLKAIRANLALQLFGENIFNRIKNQEDVFIDKAIKTLDTL